MTNILVSLALKVGLWIAKRVLAALVKRLSPQVVAWLKAGVAPAAEMAKETEATWDDKLVDLVGPVLEADAPEAVATPPNGR